MVHTQQIKVELFEKRIFLNEGLIKERAILATDLFN